LTDQWEIILVNDGSSDGTADVLQKLHQHDARIKVVQFARNFGYQMAITAGLKYASGQAVITMDADLQHPPELIPEMVKLWRSGKHIVNTVRTYGQEIGWFKRKSSELFYRTCNVVSDVKLIPNAADFRLIDKAVADQFNAMPESFRFVRGMIRWMGFKEAELEYAAQPRRCGVSKLGLFKMLRLAADGILGFSVAPLRWIIYIGLAVALMSVLYAVYVFGEVIITGNTTPGWPTLIVAILFLGGMQLTALGVLGEYIGRIYMETKHRPLFVVEETLGLETATEKDDSLVRAA
jgi:dolichol-phosphate mannosyltransferase